MNEERQARLLAEWLEGPADQGAPEGIDADVLEAIYVLQPDRAPPPRVSIEHILSASAPAELAAPAEPIALVPTGAVAPARGGPPARGWRRWAYGGGGLAAAAALLIFSLAGPLSGLRDAPEPGATPELGAAPESSSVPAPSAALELGAAPALDAVAERGDEALGEDAVAELDDEALGEDAAGRRVEAERLKRAAEPTPEVLAAADAPAAEEDATAPVSAASGLVEAKAGAPAAEPASAAVSRGAVAASRAPAVQTLDRIAYPPDYEVGWYRDAGLDEATLAGIERALEAAAAQLRDGAYLEASLTCEALIGAPDPRVGQDFAYRAADYAWRAGDGARALGLIERGIGRSSANTPQLSMLYATRGAILEALGDGAGAAAAREVADNLSAARR